ncbi:uncharacterized protein CLUP02_03286 [Colletotrichum lupini]|uniref:Uncharacterized protein n=1 Tax=Colletotrichum lupini TaxID=145971 RepID=A0A9Q8SIZ2_9PEZI|nr:uncharacterized protein CLUP02_03286 [Colletotrichum lupini]UQC77815.1 hypothetical protein CLUP02_03286 [Colletotrichum lupini]
MKEGLQKFERKAGAYLTWRIPSSVSPLDELPAKYSYQIEATTEGQLNGCLFQWHQLRHYGTERRGPSPAWTLPPYLLPFSVRSLSSTPKLLKFPPLDETSSFFLGSLTLSTMEQAGSIRHIAPVLIKPSNRGRQRRILVGNYHLLTACGALDSGLWSFISKRYTVHLQYSERQQTKHSSLSVSVFRSKIALRTIEQNLYKHRYFVPNTAHPHTLFVSRPRPTPKANTRTKQVRYPPRLSTVLFALRLHNQAFLHNPCRHAIPLTFELPVNVMASPSINYTSLSAAAAVTVFAGSGILGSALQHQNGSAAKLDAHGDPVLKWLGLSNRPRDGCLCPQLEHRPLNRRQPLAAVCWPGLRQEEWCINETRNGKCQERRLARTTCHPRAHTRLSSLERLSYCSPRVRRAECPFGWTPIIGKSPKDLLRADPTQPFPFANTNSNTSPGLSPVVGQPPASLQYFLKPSISRASLGRTNQTFADAPRILCCCLLEQSFRFGPERSTLRDIRPISTIVEPAGPPPDPPVPQKTPFGSPPRHAMKSGFDYGGASRDSNVAPSFYTSSVAGQANTTTQHTPPEPGRPSRPVFQLAAAECSPCPVLLGRLRLSTLPMPLYLGTGNILETTRRSPTPTECKLERLLIFDYRRQFPICHLNIFILALTSAKSGHLLTDSQPTHTLGSACYHYKDGSIVRMETTRAPENNTTQRQDFPSLDSRRPRKLGVDVTAISIEKGSQHPSRARRQKTNRKMSISVDNLTGWESSTVCPSGLYSFIKSASLTAATANRYQSVTYGVLRSLTDVLGCEGEITKIPSLYPSWPAKPASQDFELQASNRNTHEIRSLRECVRGWQPPTCRSRMLLALLGWQLLGLGSKDIITYIILAKSRLSLSSGLGDEVLNSRGFRQKGTRTFGNFHIGSFVSRPCTTCGPITKTNSQTCNPRVPYSW